MSDVEEQTVSKHEHGLEDPEEPLVAHDGRDRVRVEPRLETEAGGGEVFHNAVDGADGDEGGTTVEGGEEGGQVLGEEASVAASAVEGDGEEEESREDGELDDQSCFEDGAADVLFAFGEVGVGAVGGAVAVEGFHDGGDGAESGDDAARMEGGVVGDVV